MNAMRCWGLWRRAGDIDRGAQAEECVAKRPWMHLDVKIAFYFSRGCRLWDPEGHEIGSYVSWQCLSWRRY